MISSQEGISKIAKFPENDPTIMEKMIEYMYLGNYSDGRRQPSAAVTVVETSTLSSRTNEDNQERFILYSDDANIVPVKLSKPLKEPVGEPVGAPEDKVKLTEEPDYITNWPSVWLGAPFLNAQVYAIAEQFDIPSLKQLAKDKYAEVVPAEWNSASFVASLQLMYELTPESDRLLKEVALKTAGEHCTELVDRSDFVQLCKNNGEISVDVLKASLVAVPNDRICDRCLTSNYVTPKGVAKGVYYYCSSCYNRFW